MFEKIRVIFTIPELKRKIFITLILLAVYRIGYWITLPMVDQEILALSNQQTGGLADFITRVSVFAASNLQQATIFGLGIMPYISASIILQLLGSVWKPLEELKKEGEAGRKKINEYTRLLTVVLCLVQSFAYVKFWLMASSIDGESMIHESFRNTAGTLSFGWMLTAVLIMTCGTVFLMWLGEQIDEYGIGNGISLLIMAGIIAALPGAISGLLQGNVRLELTGFGRGVIGVETLITLGVVFVGVVVGVVFITLGQRRIPTQSAKHVRGRRVYGGTRQYLPLKINQGGVMPIIFASSLLMLPGMVFGALRPLATPGGAMFNIWDWLTEIFMPGTGLVYNLMYIVMIYFFCYFWTAITFNPKEMSENLKDYGTFIPGYRPGARTADYLEKVMVRITYVGAGFLAVVAIVPTLVAGGLGVDMALASFYGGTGLLIAVSVAFDLVQKIDSHLVMRNYSGLLE